MYQVYSLLLYGLVSVIHTILFTVKVLLLHADWLDDVELVSVGSGSGGNSDPV